MEVWPAASVVVCTRNRRGLLAGCLGSLDAQLPFGSGGFEIVVVDNGSTDGSGDFLRRWAAASPAERRVVPEPVPSLSLARNAGTHAARGEVVCFLDDDALAPRGWVAAHMAAYRHWPGTDAVGGPVVLTWPAGRPGWLTPRLDHWYSALDHGEEARPFPGDHGPYGTNMSVRRARLLDLGGFRDELARKRRGLISGDEGDLWHRLWSAGGAIRYEPATLLLHRIDSARCTRRWVLRRGWAQGRSNARRDIFDGVVPTVDRTPASDLARRCWDELRRSVADGGRLLRTAVHGGQPATIDDLARRAGHAATAVEHAWLWARRPAWAGASDRSHDSGH